MRRILLLAFIAIAAICSTAQAGTAITQAQLPKEARNFISKYFSADKIRKVEKDMGHRGMEYEVDFISGAEVDFREDGNWKEVKCKQSSVPKALIPQGIKEYLKHHYTNAIVKEIERYGNKHEVKLSNGLEITFDKDFRVIDIDD